MSSSKKSKSPRRSRGSHATGRHGADRRSHVTTLVALGALGWRLTEMRPSIDAPVLWRVTITSHTGLSMTAHDAADPFTALDELAVYASTDPESMDPEAP